ncbi:uncharacterized protein [Heptranchias perlo]|uniref:uncharacterized protein isoform X2 n=1 Tax=Heptranchias perlo TaxID=212740 RepID=UPI00355A3925
MEKDAFILLQLLAFAVWGNSLLTSSLSAKDNTNLHNQSQSNQSERKTNGVCNETVMLEVVHWCGYQFESQLNGMNSSDWCNFTLIAGKKMDQQKINEKKRCNKFCDEDLTTLLNEAEVRRRQLLGNVKSRAPRKVSMLA